MYAITFSGTEWRVIPLQFQHYLKFPLRLVLREDVFQSSVIQSRVSDFSEDIRVALRAGMFAGHQQLWRYVADTSTFLLLLSASIASET